MTLRHLRIYISVCQELNMTKAANKLHMTQPSVSQVIHELEDHYRSRLFERLGHRLIITSAGACLLKYACELIRLNSQIESAMKNMRESCPLRIGASVTIGEAVLVELIKHMQKKEPQQEIFSEIHNTAELEDMLLNDTLDLALVEGEIKSEYILTVPFAIDELIFIASPDNLLAQKKLIDSNALKNMPFFVREAGSGTRNLFQEVMAEADIQYKIAGVYNNAESLKKAVEAGIGFSVISSLAVKNELKHKKLITFTAQNISFKRTFRIAHHKNKYITPQLQKIIDACCCIGKKL